MPTCLDFHTHHPIPEGEATVPSFGLHPWYLTEQLKTLSSQPVPGISSFATHKESEWSSSAIEELIDSQIQSTLPLHGGEGKGPASFFLIGECGLDRLCPTPFPLQLAAFEAQIRLSERLRRPLVLHCVRAADDVLRLHRGTTQPWIWHGFRGKPEQMQQLLQHGFYLSFGFRFNEDSLRTCPANRLFLETDDDPRPVATLYAVAAALRGTTPEDLNLQCWDNAHAIIHNS